MSHSTILEYLLASFSPAGSENEVGPGAERDDAEDDESHDRADSP